MNAKTYASPNAFKQALEQRLRARAKSGPEVERRRQLLVFDRFLARIAAVFGDAATLKGGLVLELRIDRARSTNDVDLRMTGAPDEVLSKLQAAGRRDLGDFMTFEVVTDTDHPEILNEGMRYTGRRFRAVCRLAGRLYGQPFGVDAAFGDPMFGEPDVVVAEDVLAFAGVAPPTLRVYPVETHVAEKVHAYTMPRLRTNTHVKDLPDLALLASVGALDAERMRAALGQTFQFRNTHAVPLALPPPPPSWAVPYAKIASDDALPWATVDDVTRAAMEFLDPVLAGPRHATWSPDNWQWVAGGVLRGRRER